MPIETIKRILEYWRGTPMWCVAPFMNGEPMLEIRLPEINDMIQKTIGCMSLIDTNGSVYANRELLVHPNMRMVRFTVSAATRETYNKTMGVDLFPDVLSTIEWFKKNKYRQQKMMIQFVSNKHNEHEIDDWMKLFRGVPLRISGLHRAPLFQKASEEALGEKMANPAERVMLVDPDGRTSFEKLKPNSPCTCWDIQSFGWNGSITQCVKFPYSFNYGNVLGSDLRQAWTARNLNALNNPCCQGCNTRSPNSASILKKWGNRNVH
jgi:MoaA/NifB/PqqE/SkfB family radical SAM enzyme